MRNRFNPLKAVYAWLTVGVLSILILTPAQSQSAKNLENKSSGPVPQGQLKNVFTGPPYMPSNIQSIPLVIYGELANGTTTTILSREQIVEQGVDGYPETLLVSYENPLTGKVDETRKVPIIYGFDAASLSPDGRIVLFSVEAIREWLGLYHVGTSRARFLREGGANGFLWDSSGKKFVSYGASAAGNIHVGVIDLANNHADVARYWVLEPGENAEVNVDPGQSNYKVTWLIPGKKFRIEIAEMKAPAHHSRALSKRRNKGKSLRPHRQGWVFDIESGALDTEPSVEIKK
jgi:hypothetical protein